MTVSSDKTAKVWELSSKTETISYTSAQHTQVGGEGTEADVADGETELDTAHLEAKDKFESISNTPALFY